VYVRLPFVPPAWFASSVQIPEALKLTAPPLIEHTVEDEPSTLSVTPRPDVAVAVALYVVSLTMADDGATEVNVMVWVAATEKD
jgi:hypothetical protein